MEIANISWWSETRPPFFASAFKLQIGGLVQSSEARVEKEAGQVRARQQLLQNGRLPFHLGSSEIGFNSLVFLHNELPSILHCNTLAWFNPNFFLQILVEKLTLPLSISLRMVFLYCFFSLNYNHFYQNLCHMKLRYKKTCVLGNDQ